MFLYFVTLIAKKIPTVIYYTEGTKNLAGCRIQQDFAKKKTSGSLLPDEKTYSKIWITT